MSSVNSTMLVDISKTFGAVLMGSLFASVLSGFLAVQIVIYYKMYPEDSAQNKGLVFMLWFIDIFHTICMWAALWSAFIDNFGNVLAVFVIPWTVALAVLLTGVTNFLFHLFWLQRIFQLSKRNWWLTITIMFFVLVRVGSSIVSSVFMIKLGNVQAFKDSIGWNFTLGLSLSSLVDAMVTVSLFILLQKSRTGADTINSIITSLIWYTFETGLLTCAGTISTLICWVIFPNYLIFLGIHFTIIKLYSNSLLVNLNLRRHIREANSFSLRNDPTVPIIRRSINFKGPKSDRGSLSSTGAHTESNNDNLMTVEVNIQRTVHFNV